jgi:hypothetical protein
VKNRGASDVDEEMSGDESFLSRFSRRKTMARRAASDAALPTSPDQLEEAQTSASDTQEEQPAPLTDEDMPPVESLTADSDYSGFLSPKVSEQLRNLALRKLFHSDKFNVIDELDEYIEDYTYFEPLGDTVTADIRHRLEMEARRMAAEAKEAEEAQKAEATLVAGKEAELSASDDDAAGDGNDQAAPEAEGDTADDGPPVAETAVITEEDENRA